jgi:hypothetical protein
MELSAWQIILLTIIGFIVLRVLFVFILAGGDIRRIGLAFRSSWRILRDSTLAARVAPLLTPPAAPEAKPQRPSGVPLRMLALLQREGRLLDFLQEDIQGYPDDQVGAAVRDIHRQCHAALKEHLVLEAILGQSEGETVEVPAGFDPSAIQLTGNVTGQPPFRGTLRHHGWQAKEIKLAPPPAGQDELVLQPAEVELP